MTDTTTINLTPAEKKALKAQAHALNPVVLIGDKGLTEQVIKEVDHSLNAHGLIKVRVTGDEREARIECAQTLCDTLGAALVQHIGKLLVLYRPQPAEILAKKAPKRKPKPPRQTKRQFASKD